MPFFPTLLFFNTWNFLTRNAQNDTYAQRSPVVNIPTQIYKYSLLQLQCQTRHKLSDEFEWIETRLIINMYKSLYRWLLAPESQFVLNEVICISFKYKKVANGTKVMDLSFINLPRNLNWLFRGKYSVTHIPLQIS